MEDNSGATPRGDRSALDRPREAPFFRPARGLLYVPIPVETVRQRLQGAWQAEIVEPDGFAYQYRYRGHATASTLRLAVHHQKTKPYVRGAESYYWLGGIYGPRDEGTVLELAVWEQDGVAQLISMLLSGALGLVFALTTQHIAAVISFSLVGPALLSFVRWASLSSASRKIAGQLMKIVYDDPDADIMDATLLKQR